MSKLHLHFTDGPVSPWLLSRFLEKFTQAFSRSFLYQRVLATHDFGTLYLEPRSARMPFPGPPEDAAYEMGIPSRRFVPIVEEDDDEYPLKIVKSSATPVPLLKEGTDTIVDPKFYRKLLNLQRPVLFGSDRDEPVYDASEESLEIAALSLNSPLDMVFAGSCLADLVHEFRFGHKIEERQAAMAECELELKKLEIEKSREVLRILRSTSALPPLATRSAEALDDVTQPATLPQEVTPQNCLIAKQLESYRQKDLRILDKLFLQAGLRHIDIEL